jgi:hypothetical protein
MRDRVRIDVDRRSETVARMPSHHHRTCRCANHSTPIRRFLIDSGIRDLGKHALCKKIFASHAHPFSSSVNGNRTAANASCVARYDQKEKIESAEKNLISSRFFARRVLPSR